MMVATSRNLELLLGRIPSHAMQWSCNENPALLWWFLCVWGNFGVSVPILPAIAALEGLEATALRGSHTTRYPGGLKKYLHTWNFSGPKLTYFKIIENGGNLKESVKFFEDFSN